MSDILNCPYAVLASAGRFFGLPKAFSRVLFTGWKHLNNCIEHYDRASCNYYKRVTPGYTAGGLQVGGVDNCLPVSRLALYQWCAGTRGGLDVGPDRREAVGFDLVTRRCSVYS
jgi:hypothetical protein